MPALVLPKGDAPYALTMTSDIPSAFTSPAPLTDRPVLSPAAAPNILNPVDGPDVNVNRSMSANV